MDPGVNQEQTADETITDEAAEAAFESGYTGAPTEIPPPEAKKPDDAPAETTEVPAAPAQEPLSVDAQLQDIVAKVKTVDEMKLAIEKLRGDAFGKLGGLERILKQLQDSSTGQAIEVSAADLSELEAEFPGLNLGPSLAKGLTRVLSKVKGPAVKGLSQEEVDAQIEARLRKEAADREERRKQDAVEALAEEHEDWSTVIGPPDSQTEFRVWLKSLGPEKEQKFLSSWNPNYVGKVLTEFKSKKAATPPPTPEPTPPKADAGKKDSRSQRLAEAVPVKGGGLPPAKSRQTDEEAAFEAGFTGGR